MKKEMSKEEQKEYFNANYYFGRALQNYLEFQEVYREKMSVQERPENPNVIPLYLVNHLANGLAEEEISFDAILSESLTHARFGTNMTDMVGIFLCNKCQEKGVIPITVKTNRDHIQLMKNGQFDFKAHEEYQNTEEVISLDFMIPKDFAPGCTCSDRTGEMNEWLMDKTYLGIHLSDESVVTLKSIGKKNKQRFKTEGINREG